LLELARYLPRNPVRAHLCQAPEEWPWSSYASTAGIKQSPWFLEHDTVLDLLGSTQSFAAWVSEGDGTPFLDEDGIPVPPARVPLEELLLDFSDQTIANAHYGHAYSKAAIARFLGVSPGQITRRLA
jgi:hypothetical protein